MRGIRFRFLLSGHKMISARPGKRFYGTRSPYGLGSVFLRQRLVFIVIIPENAHFILCA
jgi:hypothetical protein